MRRRNWILVSALLTGAVFGGLFGDRVLAREEEQSLAYDRFVTTLDLIERNYADSIEADRLVVSAIRGMLQRLDPHSNFLDPKSYMAMRDEQRGSFSGLGIVVTKKDFELTVISPIEDTPAYRLGIRGGDVISKIEGEETREISLDTAVSKLKGPKGTEVTITISRFGVDPFELTIVRDDIPTKSVPKPFELQPGIGYIRIKNFTQTTADEVEEALAQLRKDGMKALLLDLRNNPGGLLEQAVKVSSMFLQKGQTVVYTKGRLPDSNQSFAASGDGQTDFPVLVLVNKYSASASEIVSGAIQDHDRGLIVGETTWGKGLVQTVFSLKYNAGLALTTAKYYTPSGRSIQRDYKGDFDDFQEYYNHDAAVAEEPTGTGYSTDVGRTVFGGGGIRPDIEIEPHEASDFEERLLRTDAYFKFGVRHLAELGEVPRDYRTTDEAVRFFRKMLEEDGLEYAPEEWDESATWIRNRIAESVVSNAYGMDEAYRIRVRGDQQVLAALEQFTKARELASRAGEIKSD